METPDKGSPLLVCTSCGRPAESGQHMCEHCGAPMTPYAHSDPVMGIMARGFAAHRATTNPRKPIVVIGMWLWMVPGFFAGLYMTTLGIGLLLCLGVAMAQNAVYVREFVKQLAVWLGVVILLPLVVWSCTTVPTPSSSGQ